MRSAQASLRVMQGQIRFAFSQTVQPLRGTGGDNPPVSSSSTRSPGIAPLDGFHPAVAAWFAGRFPAPTDAQIQAWPAIRSGRHVLVSAPTGSGKTLTAFLAGIDALVRDGLEGRLQDATRIVYVSPLKALSNDIRVNLEQPLAGIREELARLGLPDVDIRTAVRTGDTPQAERAAMRRLPPHILVTTPESLYVLLGSESGRAMLAPARTVIVDEIHAIADDKRGSHLALSLERLEALCGRPLTRIGVSATQKPIDEVARFLVGAGNVSSPGSTRGSGLGRECSSSNEQTQEQEHSRPRPLPQDGCEACVADCEIVDIGYAKQRDLALVLPATPLSVVMSHDQWAEVYGQIAVFAQTHRTTLVFVNTRRMAERSARHLGELLGKEHVAAHHGSLSKELRLDAEQRLKRGELKLLVATASLELGIDIGDVDLVCQLGSPRAIAAFLQRAGRAGHHVGGVPKARLFPSSRDDLVECAALLDCIRRGELDTLRIPPAPVDVLAQHIVAEVACREWDEDALYDWLRRAWPYRDLSRADFDAIVRMVAEGYATRRGPRAGLLHRDAVNRKLRGRKGGRMTALMSGGTIPDTGDYSVLMEPESLVVGSVNEDFAVESTAGDIFQLGNTSYRVLRVEPGRVRVEDAQGAPPSIPFWLGEAPGRTDELSAAVSRLRSEVAERIAVEPLSHRGDEERLRTTGPRDDERPRAVREGRGAGGGEGAQHEKSDTDMLFVALPSDAGMAAPSVPSLSEPSRPLPEGEGSDAPNDPMHWLTCELSLPLDAAVQLHDYIAATRATLGTLPTQQRIVLERFFDESGGTQLVIHSPFGSRINRAWGLALRKRFCRKFNFELQAAATEDAIVLSLSTSHSFPLIEVASYLHSNSALDILVQALLDAPLFGVRWRWNATTALALPRFQGGKKVAPQLQRMKSEDLLASVFPDQVACLENIVGERQVPDHPLVAQTLRDCLYEAMDATGWLGVLRGMESGAIEVIARDLAAPSPLAMEAINARPYAFLDDAPLEERRTQAVQSRRYTDPRDASDLGRLDPGAIDAVREQAWPDPRSADEMHEALQTLGFVTREEVESNAAWGAWLRQLARDQRATCVRLCRSGFSRELLTRPPEAGHSEQAEFAAEAAPTKAIVLWTCAERLPQLQMLFPDAALEPPIEAPPECIDTAQDRAASLAELLRARLGGLGPVTADALSGSLPVERSELDVALLQLQDEGVAMQGHFSGHADDPPEWCERHLLARIHRYTLARLRREIEPVEARDYVRFACDWQKLTRATRVSGPDALAGVLTQLEGYEAPAAAWESELLPARVCDYSIAWLDDQCTAGRTLWTRLRASSGEADNPRAPASVRGTPVVLLPRRTAAQWARLTQAQGEAAPLSSRAQKVLGYLASHGASFFDDLVDGAGLLRTELEDALAELVSRGRVHCDSFAGLRALLIPASKRGAGRGGRRASLFGLQDAGRWAAVPQAAAGAAPVRGSPPESVEHVARTLLRRYGVVCWRLLEREAAWLPPWRELVRVLQRLEARGEIRGGRFIAGLSGEQFALPEAIALLRQVRRRAHDGELLCVSAADPLNLAGTLLPGDKVPRIPGARLLLRDGVVVATLVAGEVAYAAGFAEADHPGAKQMLLREPGSVAWTPADGALAPSRMA
jgi:ATP-dependent Lhr-like helicase